MSSQWLGLLNCSFLEIHVGSQWLGLLKLPSSRDPRDPREQSVARPTEPARFLRSTSPRGPQAPQIHRSTESTEPGSSPDLLDLSYAAMQILTVLIYLLLQAAPDSTRFTQCRISLFTISLIPHTHTCAEPDLTYPTHSHLGGNRFDLSHTLTLGWE